MKKIVFLCIVITCSLSVLSQNNYKKAAIFFSSGDSVECYVKDREWLINPSGFTIKRTMAGKSESLDVNTLSRIVIENGDRYIAANVTIDITPSEFQTAFIDPEQIKTEDARVFLLAEYISKPFSLYSLLRNRRTHLYLQKDQGAYEELIYRDVTLLRDGTYYQTEDKTYTFQLTEAFAGCEKAIEKTKHIYYSSGDIISTLKIYDQQTGQYTQQYVNDKSLRGKLNIDVMAGASHTKTVFAASGVISTDYVVTKNPLKTDPVFSAGLRFDYVLPRLHKKISFLLDVIYNSYKATATDLDYTSSDFYDKKTVNIHPSLIRFNPMARYRFLQGPLTPFIQGGFAVSYALNHKDQVVLNEHLFSQDNTSNRDPYAGIEYKKLQLGYTAGAGIEYKRFSIDYKYEHTTGFASTLNLSSSIAVQTILLGFQVNR